MSSMLFLLFLIIACFLTWKRPAYGIALIAIVGLIFMPWDHSWILLAPIIFGLAGTEYQRFLNRSGQGSNKSSAPTSEPDKEVTIDVPVLAKTVGDREVPLAATKS